MKRIEYDNILKSYNGLFNDENYLKKKEISEKYNLPRLKYSFDIKFSSDIFWEYITSKVEKEDFENYNYEKGRGEVYRMREIIYEYILENGYYDDYVFLKNTQFHYHKDFFNSLRKNNLEITVDEIVDFIPSDDITFEDFLLDRIYQRDKKSLYENSIVEGVPLSKKNK